MRTSWIPIMLASCDRGADDQVLGSQGRLTAIVWRSGPSRHACLPDRASPDIRHPWVLSPGYVLDKPTAEVQTRDVRHSLELADNGMMSAYDSIRMKCIGT